MPHDNTKRPTIEDSIKEQEQQEARFPPVRFLGYNVHVFQQAEDGEFSWSVWINPESDTFYGLCIGTGRTRESAVADAAATLLQATNAMQDAGRLS